MLPQIFDFIGRKYDQEIAGGIHINKKFIKKF